MKDEIIKKFLLEDVSKYGVVMTLNSFIACVKSGGFIDYDGYGKLVYKGKQVENSTICDEEEFEIENEIYTMKSIKKIFGNEIGVVWFNR